LTQTYPVIGINERPVRAIQKTHLDPVTTRLHEQRQYGLGENALPRSKVAGKVHSVGDDDDDHQTSVWHGSRSREEGHSPRKISSQGDSIHMDMDSIDWFDMNSIS